MILDKEIKLKRLLEIIKEVDVPNRKKWKNYKIEIIVNQTGMSSKESKQ